jgi:hypothetical protein
MAIITDGQLSVADAELLAAVHVRVVRNADTLGRSDECAVLCV